MKSRGRIDWELLQGFGVVSLIALMVAVSLYWAHHPEPHVPAMGSFHCDASGHLPCDGGR